MKTYPCQGCGKTLPLLRREEEVEAVRVVGIARAYRLLRRNA